MSEVVVTRQTFFISRTGVDAERAKEVARVLMDAGHKIIIQDRDFGPKNFLGQMDQGLASGARVIAILSPGYLTTDYCAAEWMNALAGDPLNRSERLVVLRVAPCAPRGLLRTIAYWDLVPFHDSAELRAEVIRNAVLPEAQRSLAAKPGLHWHPPGALLHEHIREVPNFTGRGAELLEVDNQLWHRKARAAAIIQ